MNISEMISWLDIKQDKPDSPYFTTAEKLQFLNNAQDTLVNRYIFQHLFPTHRMGQGSARVYSSVEANVSGSETLEPLFVLDLPLTSSASGTIARSEIKSAMNIETGDSTDYLAILGIAKKITSDSNVPVKFVRINDFEQFQRNDYKKATLGEPQYRIERNRLKFLPSGEEDYSISVIKTPIRMVYDEITPSNNVSCELPVFTHNDIVSIALGEVAVSSRDAALAQLQKLSDQNLTTLA